VDVFVFSGVYDEVYQWHADVFVFTGVYEGEYQWRMEVFMLSGVYDGTYQWRADVSVPRVSKHSGDLVPSSLYYFYTSVCLGARGGAAVKALRYKPAGRGFDSRWCNWNFQ
jgi:hypothetical protein